MHALPAPKQAMACFAGACALSVLFLLTAVDVADKFDWQ